MKQEFIKRWSVWWTLHKDKQLLDEAFAKELDELIEQKPKPISASQFWQNKFGEDPKTDRDKLTCALMQEYYKEINK